MAHCGCNLLGCNCEWPLKNSDGWCYWAYITDHIGEDTCKRNKNGARRERCADFRHKRSISSVRLNFKQLPI